MTILTQYVLKQIVKIFVMCFAGLMTIYLVIDFFEKIRKFLKYDAQAFDMFLFFLFTSPSIASQMAPVAVLMATLLSMGILTRNHEITAMRSGGVSPLQMTLPFLGFAALVSWLLFVMGAVVSPIGLLQAEYVKKVRMEQKVIPEAQKTGRTWIQLGDQSLMSVEAIGQGGTILNGVSLYRLGPEFKLLQFTEAKQARFADNGWTLYSGVDRTLLDHGALTTRSFETRPIQLTQIPKDFYSWLSVKSKEMTLANLKAYADRLRRDGYNFSPYLTDYYGRIAFPFVSLVMTIVGLALSLRSAGIRGAGMARNIGQALCIAFLYWATHHIAIAFGREGVLIPMVAGWFANLLFLSFGGYLLLKVRY